MKVLWFTNNAVSLNTKELSGGWMQSLEQALTALNDIQLFIATKAKNGRPGRSEVGKTVYYSISDPRTKIQKRMDLTFNREPNEYFLNRYLSVIRDVKPDIIQIFGTEMDYGLICENTDVPVVIHTQGILQVIYHFLQTHAPSFLEKIKTNNINNLILGSTIGNGLRIMAKRCEIESRILKACRNVMGRTAWDKRVLSILAPNAQYFHCDEMLRSEFFLHNWVYPQSEILVISSTISNPAYKGHDNIISTCRALKNAGINFIWNVIGIDEQSDAYRLFYRKQHSDLLKHILFHGNIDAKTMINYLLHSNIYVHPSHIENSSNALCEAMALGMPVIALDVGGNVSMVHDHFEGLIAPDNDPYSLAGLIKYLSENSDFSTYLGKNAKTRARLRHNPELIIAQIKSIYYEIIQKHEVSKR